MSGLHHAAEQQKYAAQAPGGIGPIAPSVNWYAVFGEANATPNEAPTPNGGVLALLCQRLQVQLSMINEITRRATAIADRVFGPVPEASGECANQASGLRSSAAVGQLENSQEETDYALHRLINVVERLETL